jgi:KDO2-lipid IV(A) lauroyltransferase
MAVPDGPAKRAFDRISFLAFLAFRSAVNLLPWNAAYVLGDLLALAWWFVDARHRSLALANLGIAFPELLPSARRRIAFRSFRHLSWVLVETLRYGKINRDNWRERASIVHPEHFEEAAKRGRGVVAVSGHLGNWEWLSVHALAYGHVNIVARAIHNPLMDREIRGRREAAGIHQIYPTRESPREILRRLKDGESLCFLVDQSAKGEEGVDVPFFGRPAPTHTGPALIALRSGAPVFPVWTYRGRDRRIRVEYGAAFEPVRTGDRKRDVVETTALFTRKIEQAVRAHPEQWFWVHDRWRIRKRRRRSKR